MRGARFFDRTPQDRNLIKKCDRMDKEARKWLAIASITIAVVVILLLLLSEFDLSGFEIHKGIRIN